ncbi:MAG: TetR family transcriptional regulator [Myxococcota bacterium]|nr:TetR family transcriptional regulator [Myxococcota bacterium]
MEERAQRIVDTAIELAERGGFEAVRLRDVAADAGVALGTLYRRFRSKEDLLIAALEAETASLEERIRARLPRGSTALERVSGFFEVATRGICRRPNLARACIRAAASGDPELAQRVAGFQHRVEALVVSALRGRPVRVGADIDEADLAIASTLQLVWFASLVAWSGELQGREAVIDQMRKAAAQILPDSRSGH